MTPIEQKPGLKKQVMKLIKNIMKKTTALVLILIFLLTGCGSTQEGYKVGTWKTAQTIQPFYYKDYLEDDIEVLPFTNPGDQKTALLAGNLDMTGTTLVTAITAASKGEPVVIVSSLCNKCSALVVGTDSGIEKIEDLKYKRIAYVPGTMHHILLLETLEKAGLDPETDVDLIRIDFFDMGQALANGDIDAFCSGEPFPSVAEIEGYGKVIAYPYFDDSIGTINGAMITTKDRIENSKDKIQALVTAHVKSSEHLKLEREFWMSEAAKFGTDDAVLDIAVGNMEIAWNIDEEYILKAEKLAKRMMELGIIDNIPDMEELFDTSFVENAMKLHELNPK